MPLSLIQAIALGNHTPPSQSGHHKCDENAPATVLTNPQDSTRSKHADGSECSTAASWLCIMGSECTPDTTFVRCGGMTMISSVCVSLCAVGTSLLSKQWQQLLHHFLRVKRFGFVKSIALRSSSPRTVGLVGQHVLIGARLGKGLEVTHFKRPCSFLGDGPSYATPRGDTEALMVRL